MHHIPNWKSCVRTYSCSKGKNAARNSAGRRYVRVGRSSRQTGAKSRFESHSFSNSYTACSHRVVGYISPTADFLSPAELATFTILLIQAQIWISNSYVVQGCIGIISRTRNKGYSQFPHWEVRKPKIWSKKTDWQKDRQTDSCWLTARKSRQSSKKDIWINGLVYK